jgi:hypothetical protein
MPKVATTSIITLARVQDNNRFVVGAGLSLGDDSKMRLVDIRFL